LQRRFIQIFILAAFPLAAAALILANAGMGRPQSPVTRHVAALPPLHFPISGLPPIRGFSIQLDNPHGMPDYLRAIKKLHTMGCRWINFVINARQHDVHAENIHLDRRVSLTPAQIRHVLLYAHQQGISTMLMPIILLNHATGNDWRGVIKPPNWNLWFTRYRAYILAAAAWAQQGHVAIFSVGSELLSTEPFNQQWLRIIRMVRRRFHGKLTYSANWDHYQYVHFWPRLNYIGMNSYYDLSDSTRPTTAAVMARWRGIQHRILTFAARQHKPVLFTEIGWDNLSNTLAKPWDYVGTGLINPHNQLIAYQAFVRVWRKLPPSTFAGALIWEWLPGCKPADYGAYSPQGEPALPLIQHWVSGR
jgi:hypothetical protein